MTWPRFDRRSIAAAALLSWLLAACDRDAADKSASGNAADSGRALHLADPELYATCDSLQHWTVDAMTGEVERINGRFNGSVHGGTRYGCRLTAADTLAPEVPQRPLERVWQALAARGWVVDQAYVADSPEGSMLGLRSGSQLCVLQHYWRAPSDDERATNPDAPFHYDVAIECFREAARPAEPG